MAKGPNHAQHAVYVLQHLPSLREELLCILVVRLQEQRGKQVCWVGSNLNIMLSTTAG
jgi:hypothetical protein